MRTIPRASAALALGALLMIGPACSSTDETGASDGPNGGERLTATVPPSGESSTTTEDLSSDDTGTDDTGTLPAACELITESDASEAFGEPALGGEERSDECWWSSANDLKTVNIIRRTDDVETWRSGYENDSWHRIDLGDEGYTSEVFDSVVWRVGDVQYEVNVVYSTSGDPEQVVTELSELAASRL